MSDPAMLDKTFQIVMKRMVDTGVAPHYTEIAGELGLTMEEGRKAVHDLFAAGIPGWLFPDEGTEDGVVPLDDSLKLFSGSYFRRRLDPDWVSRSREYSKEWVATLIEIGKTGRFWRPQK